MMCQVSLTVNIPTTATVSGQTHEQQAAEKLTGRHDFRNFSSAKKTKSTVREIFDIDIYGDIEEMQILIHADDFLHNMARIIVGTLMDIGLGNRSVQDIDDIILPESWKPCTLRSEGVVFAGGYLLI